jgi:hypothetical protein
MHKETAKALYSLQLDAFLEGLSDEYPIEARLGLEVEEGREVREETDFWGRYGNRVRRQVA